jgi:hypothetical protein
MQPRTRIGLLTPVSQSVSPTHFTAQRGAGHHQPRTFDGKRPVDRQTEAVMAGVVT